MLVFYRARGEDWDRFVGTLHGHFRELEDAGCVRVEAYRHRHRVLSAFVPEPATPAPAVVASSRTSALAVCLGCQGKPIQPGGEDLKLLEQLDAKLWEDVADRLQVPTGAIHCPSRGHRV